MRHRFSANTGFLWRDLPFTERIARAGAAGFDAVEFHDEAQSVGEADVRAALREAGLPLVCLNTRMGDSAGCAAIPGQETQARDDFAAALDTARALGGQAVHVLAGRVPSVSDTNGTEIERTYAQALREAARIAEPHGVTVLVEPISAAAMPGYAVPTLAGAAAILERVARPNAKLLFDCFHVQRSVGDLVHNARHHMPMIGHVQIAGGLTRAEPDHGEIDYGFVLPELVAAGYRGMFGCEYTPRGAVEAGLGWWDRFRD